MLEKKHGTHTYARLYNCIRDQRSASFCLADDAKFEGSSIATVSVEMDTDLQQITPPKHISTQKSLVFQHFYRMLAEYRNTLVLYAVMECSESGDAVHEALTKQRDIERDINTWAQRLLAKAWIVCFDREEECAF